MIEQDIIAHTKAEGVKESCGLISGGRYFPCRNISPDPRNYFEINPDDWIPSGILNQFLPDWKNDISGIWLRPLPMVRYTVCDKPTFIGEGKIDLIFCIGSF
ncbi:hypothetical protein PSI15_15735 [Xenorhabdus sp. PR6a]|uniref:hypothetical protein n=1 Tax=Xenorhabdus sp. PR6a TaxID=3025877 RepID=UPI002359CE5F|nr:hypothetical protein [Xenorhabdus sp. PR6a]MDC9582993.1 hypothetical protein [Xenorhabdus sp. PR6a]